MHGITSVYSKLTSDDDLQEKNEVKISSLADTWILLKDIESGGERNRGLYILKSRGIAHSNQMREFLITSNGINIIDVYIGQKGVLTGTARIAQENIEREEQMNIQSDCELRKRNIEANRAIVEAQVIALQKKLEYDEFEFNKSIEFDGYHNVRITEYQKKMAAMRQADISERSSYNHGKNT